MENNLRHRVYFDHILFDASQVTNPAIDPLREPMEIRTFLEPAAAKKVLPEKEGDYLFKNTVGSFPVINQIEMKIPILCIAMSPRAISLLASTVLAIAARKLATFYNTGEEAP